MSALDTTKSAGKLIKYNMKIIFGGKFFWFLLIAFVYFCYLMFQSAWKGENAHEGLIFSQMMIPALLLIFYPAVYGIQNDEDNRILEILFGIPNYMYKIWLFRLIIIYIEVYFILVLYGFAAYILLYPVNPFDIALRMMLPVLFIGNLAFLYSTVTRSGNATAVLIIITYIVILIISSIFFSNSMWNVFLNSYNIPDNMHPAIWENIVINNRIFLAIGSVVWMLMGLMSLQKREKFI